MKKLDLVTSGGKSEVFIGGGIGTAISRFDKSKTVVMADENLLRFHSAKFAGFSVISIGSGEKAKSMDQAVVLYHKLLEMEVDRSWSLIGAGYPVRIRLHNPSGTSRCRDWWQKRSEPRWLQKYGWNYTSTGFCVLRCR